MRVVLDTNILVRAAFSPTGPAGVVLELIRSHDHSLIVSEFILSELNRVLRYPRLLALHRFDDVAILNYVADIRALSLVVEISDVTPVMSNDPDDDPIIATAVVGHADRLCSCDRHFRRSEVHDYCDSFGIRVVTDLELLSELRPSKE
jgi:putative PIN family toxin of toxin-antitoxin system